MKVGLSLLVTSIHPMKVQATLSCCILPAVIRGARSATDERLELEEKLVFKKPMQHLERRVDSQLELLRKYMPHSKGGMT